MPAPDRPTSPSPQRCLGAATAGSPAAPTHTEAKLALADGLTIGQPLGPPSPEILERLHNGAARYAAFKELLYDHREDALTCYDHGGHYCCICGEHMALGYQEHLAAVLARREAARERTVSAQALQHAADALDTMWNRGHDDSVHPNSHLLRERVNQIGGE